MKSKSTFPTFLTVAGMIAVSGVCQTAKALNYTWDLDAAAGIQTGSGTWNNTDTNWSTTGISDSGWLQTSATVALHAAILAGADAPANTYDITLGINLAAQGLTFSNTGYRLIAAAPQTLALTNVGTGVIVVASAKSATIGSNATVNFNSTTNTGQRVSLTGNSILNIAAGGTLTKTGIVAGPSATGSTLGFTGGVGTINVEGTLSYNLTTPGNYGGIVISNGGASDNITLNVNSGGTVSSNSLNNGVTVVSANSGVRAGTLTVNTGGLVSTTATGSATSGINLANGVDSTGTVNLDGGTISTFQINSNYLNTSTNVLSTGGTSTFNFHGGTLKAIANNVAFMGGLTNAFIKANGAFIDTNGFNVTITQQLKTDTVSLGGGLTKQGSGTLILTGASTYTGGTAISAGTLQLNGGNLGTGAVTGSGSFVTTIGTTNSQNWSGFTGTYTHNSTLVSSVFNAAVNTSANAAYVIASTQGGAQGMIAAGNGDYTLQLGSLSGVANSMFRGGNVATGTTTLEIGNLGTNTNFQGIVQNGVTKVLALTKVGSGSLTLSGANTYTGATNVTEGTLNLTGSLGATAVTVAATLAGGGSIGSGGSLALQNGSTIQVDSSSGNDFSVGGDLTLDGVVNVGFNGVLSPTPGGTVIPFITYTGSLTGSAANLSFTGMDGFRNPQINTGTPGQIQLTTDSANLVWSGATGAWDTNTSLNWNSGAETFFNGDSVTFNDLGTTKSVVIDANVIPAAVTFDNSTGNDYSVSGTGAITGAATLTKLGTGTVTLTKANTYTGLTTVDNGTLALTSFGTLSKSSGLVINDGATVSLQNYNPLGAPTTVPVTINSGGTMTLSGGYSVNLTALTLNGGELSSGGFFDAIFGSYYLNANVTVGSGISTISAARVTAPGVRTFTVATGGTLNVTGDFSNLYGAFGLIKSGPGEMVLNSGNTYTGATTVNDGTLSYGVSDAIASGSVTVNGATAVLNLGADHADTVGVVTLDGAGAISGTGTSALTSTASFEMKDGSVSIPLAGSVPLNKTTAGTVTLSGVNTYTGNTTVTDGTLVITNDDVLADTSTVTLPASGSLNLTHSGTDTVTGLVIGGAPQLPGLYTFGTGKLKVGLSTPFEDWAILKGLDGTAGKENGPADDPDQDGSTNLAEFAFNGDPLSGSDNGQIYVLTADSDADSPDTAKELILTLAVRKTTPAFTAGAPATAPLTDGINYSIQGSTDLSTFGVTVTPVGLVDPGVALTDATNYEYRSFSLNDSNGLAGKGFLRAKAEAP